MPRIEERFGIVLRRRRLALELSQEELAGLAGIHPNYVGLIERGERAPTIVIVEKLADALGTTMSGLLKSVEREQR